MPTIKTIAPSDVVKAVDRFDDADLDAIESAIVAVRSHRAQAAADAEAAEAYPHTHLGMNPHIVGPPPEPVLELVPSHMLNGWPPSPDPERATSAELNPQWADGGR